MAKAWPPAPEPPIATATLVTTVSAARLWPPRTSMVIPPVIAVTPAAPIRALTVFFAVVSVSDTPIDPPMTPIARPPVPIVFCSDWSRSTAAMVTSVALTVPASISAVIVLANVTVPRAPAPANAPVALPTATDAATATPSDETSASEVVCTVSAPAVEVTTGSTLLPSARPIRAVTVSVTLDSATTTPGARATPAPITAASAPAPAWVVMCGSSEAVTLTSPLVVVTVDERIAASTVFRSVL